MDMDIHMDILINKKKIKRKNKKLNKILSCKMNHKWVEKESFIFFYNLINNK